LFKYLYYLLALIVYILAIPYLLFKSRSEKYKEAIPAKFFLQNNPSLPSNKIWFHSCSQGETTALKPIFEKFDKEDINLTVITNTGFAKAKELVSNVRYLPFEIFLPFWITQQKVLLVMEAELWYMLFLIAKKRGAKTVLINARINDRSYKSYQRFAFFYKQIFKYIDKVFAQSEIDKQRLILLGAKDVEVIGNLKLANLPKKTKELIKPDGVMITAGSTHESEEELILNVWEKSMGKLVIVPRHPERFDSVYKLIELKYKNSDITYHRYSGKSDFSSDIVLVDVMGELNNIYAISDLVILGGGFIKTAGGHNPIEPAYFGCKLISGKTIFNQKSLFECVENYQLVEKEELKKTLLNIDRLQFSDIGKQGDIEPIIKYIKDIK
jgi:3-deoxy-D-manno-octulosonic-acid transferase